MLGEFEDRIYKPSIYRPNLVLVVTIFPDQKVFRIIPSHCPGWHMVWRQWNILPALLSERCSQLQVAAGGRYGRDLGEEASPRETWGSGILEHVVTRERWGWTRCRLQQVSGVAGGLELLRGTGLRRPPGQGVCRLWAGDGRCTPGPSWGPPLASSSSSLHHLLPQIPHSFPCVVPLSPSSILDFSFPLLSYFLFPFFPIHTLICFFFSLSF